MAVLIQVKGSKGIVGRCDQRCYDAIAPECDCCCGGVNHGRGLNKAIGKTKLLYNSVIMANCSEGSCPEKVTRPKVEPVLFEYEKVCKVRAQKK